MVVLSKIETSYRICCNGSFTIDLPFLLLRQYKFAMDLGMSFRVTLTNSRYVFHLSTCFAQSASEPHLIKISQNMLGEVQIVKLLVPPLGIQIFSLAPFFQSPRTYILSSV
jgi:hypothetical protein